MGLTLNHIVSTFNNPKQRTCACKLADYKILLCSKVFRNYEVPVAKCRKGLNNTFAVFYYK